MNKKRWTQETQVEPGDSWFGLFVICDNGDFIGHVICQEHAQLMVDSLNQTHPGKKCFICEKEAHETKDIGFWFGGKPKPVCSRCALNIREHI